MDEVKKFCVIGLPVSHSLSPMIHKEFAKQQGINIQYKMIEPDTEEHFETHAQSFFSKKGFGTIATGTVLSGKLEKNSEVEIFPGRIIANVRSFQTHGKEARFVKNGDRAAINLSNIEHTSLKRGYVLAEKSRLAQTSKIIANIKMIKASNWKIANKQLIHIHIGTSQVVAKAITYGKEILAGESANILLDLSQPIAPLNEQKFIIRSISPMETIAGGTILDSNPQYTKKELKENIQNIKVDSSKRFFQLVQRNWKSPVSICLLYTSPSPRDRG